MYRHILIPLDNSPSDEAILQHVRPLAKLTGARITLMHVADGFGARYRDRFDLADSEEIRNDRAYLEQRQQELAAEGFEVHTVLEFGDPSKQILDRVEQAGCDLIAMSTHGHRFFSDLILGSVASEIRHRASVPILMLRAAN